LDNAATSIQLSLSPNTNYIISIYSNVSNEQYGREQQSDYSFIEVDTNPISQGKKFFKVAIYRIKRKKKIKIKTKYQNKLQYKLV